MIGSYTPRLCGIATFSSDLVRSVRHADSRFSIDVVAMSDHEGYEYTDGVRLQIREDDPLAYALAADSINRGAYDVLSVQHEYGIYGGEAGAFLLKLVREAKMPIVTTLHTVLHDPSDAQREVLEELLQLSERIVVMSRTALTLLADVHGVAPAKVDFIPHGIPHIPCSAGATLRARLGITGPMILTFGLLSPDKGIQYMIEAMPAIVARHPDARYVVVGATHPQVRAYSGESYREGLAELAKTLGVQNNVQFVDRFVPVEDLVEYLSATDFYVTPYLNPKQITSGTLAYSMGAGKAVISTPYEYAKEVLADGRGIIVPFRDPAAIANAVLETFADTEARLAMGERAAEFGAEMLWTHVGKLYVKSFERAKSEASLRLAPLRSSTPEALPTLHLDHLLKLTDDTGLFQHATFTIPNRAEGYCVDDNARGLLFTALLGAKEQLSPEVDRIQALYLSFILHAFNPTTGRFRNFMSFQRQWLEDQGSEDSHGRTVWSLGTFVRYSSNVGRRELAEKLFYSAIPALDSTTSPRTWAYAILGAAEMLQVRPECSVSRDLVQTLAERIMSLYTSVRTDRWPWMEQRLAYANARLPQALMVAGNVLDRPEMIAAGNESLAWLLDRQSGANGCFSPVGIHGAGQEDFGDVLFDQQPIEVWSSVSACVTAYRITGRDEWLSPALRCFQWFLGFNALGLRVCEPLTGGCRDGLMRSGLNENQGAESTIAYLCALTELALAQRPVAHTTPRLL